MTKARKLLALALALMLVFAVLGIAGCSSSDEAATDEETTEEAATGIMSTDDLGEGDKVGVQSGTTGEMWATENLEPKGVEVVPYDDILAAFAALQAGDVVGVINDLPISQDIAKDETRDIVDRRRDHDRRDLRFCLQQGEHRTSRRRQLGPRRGHRGRHVRRDLRPSAFGAAPMSFPEAMS